MAKDLIEETIGSLGLPDEEARAAAHARWAILATAEGSLGRLQTLAEHLAAIRGNEQPTFHHKAVVVFVADHGVTEEGVSSHPRELTAGMLHNLLDGGAAITVFSRFLRAELHVVDVGVDAPPIPPRPGFFSRKIARGTRNFAREPAMTPSQARESVRIGIEVALNLIAAGADLMAIGDLGIGNTTSASAMLAGLTGMSVEKLVGPGTGTREEQVRRKVMVISSALERHVPRREDPWEVLERVGGFEIGAMAGAFLGAASQRVPAIVDGLTSSAAALFALTLAPRLGPFLVPSHASEEPGHRVALDALGLQPYFDFATRMGEGTSAALQMGLCDLASRLLREMATVEEVAAAKEEAFNSSPRNGTSPSPVSPRPPGARDSAPPAR
ncbi:MAG: nicotinate-nucleotide--dimethylbenzimidazole phosphoribosyltransferase [Euryarchaeota archaeon]|nr:nicotinate-nucleotide--dimethylbenzimidazole phosphoribosyltransferase [Euryarchaeota archaeon]MDE1836374.1 nicotinate-nucleotide--dimethylbenzimidazole phosphoribosyltransferase [Euryarchaeota archaeon]MDE1881471.1 nicotinate-nucleotide--dimethylbenzimidazole phosphoribosyltransferase [Euryarchaeota archaeon]MDE2044230.1 nicotinate-nucleotide--dimethylbenzimidazole phosphoribosyltransferase [Thermoplasmata archaeon]